MRTTSGRTASEELKGWKWDLRTKLLLLTTEIPAKDLRRNSLLLFHKENEQVIPSSMVIGISTLRIEITKDVSDSFLSLIEGGVSHAWGCRRYSLLYYIDGDGDDRALFCANKHQVEKELYQFTLSKMHGNERALFNEKRWKYRGISVAPRKMYYL